MVVVVVALLIAGGVRRCATTAELCRSRTCTCHCCNGCVAAAAAYRDVFIGVYDEACLGLACFGQRLTSHSGGGDDDIKRHLKSCQQTARCSAEHEREFELGDGIRGSRDEGVCEQGEG